MQISIPVWTLFFSKTADVIKSDQKGRNRTKKIYGKWHLSLSFDCSFDFSVAAQFLRDNFFCAIWCGLLLSILAKQKPAKEVPGIHLSQKSLRAESQYNLSLPPQLSTQSELIRSWQTSKEREQLYSDGSLMILIHFCLETSERNDLSYSLVTSPYYCHIHDYCKFHSCNMLPISTFFAAPLNH